MAIWHTRDLAGEDLHLFAKCDFLNVRQLQQRYLGVSTNMMKSIADNPACQYGFTAVMIILGCLFCLAAQADVYIYKNEWGSSLFSDRPIKQAGYRLVEVRSTGPKGNLMQASLNSRGNYSNHNNKNSFGKGITVKSSHYDADINRCAQSYDIDPALVKAVIHVESQFNTFAESPVGAQGLMQLMPKTAAMYQVSNPFNPQENISAGCRHLQYLMGKFDSIDLVLAAYNAGEGKVEQYNGIPPYSETRNYVQKVKRLLVSYSRNNNPIIKH
jgi:soluble lytic murein transglycosylase-like protein